MSRGSSGASDPGGPQSLAGPTALLDSAGRSGLLRFASARPPLTATSGLDSGDGRSAPRPVIRVLGREPQPHGLVCFVMFSFPRFRRGQGLAMTPARRRDRGSWGRDASGGGPGCEQAGRHETCAAERPCRPVGRVPWGEGAALPRRPAQRGILANGRRSARAIVTRRAETGPGLREGLQPRVERGRPWPTRPFATPVSGGYHGPERLVLTYSQVLAACRAGETIKAQK